MAGRIFGCNGCLISRSPWSFVWKYDGASSPARMFRYAVIAAFGIASSFAAAIAGTDLKSILTQSKNNWSPKTEIFFPSDANWLTETTQRWNIYSAPTYLASIKPGTEADVQKVVCVR